MPIIYSARSLRIHIVIRFAIDTTHQLREVEYVSLSRSVANVVAKQELRVYHNYQRVGR